jgi:ElaB/YqjD/DUF883 family membrane-anchored ribosome-binding protein
MNKQTETVANDLVQLAIDARALLVATADVAEVKVVEARKRLAAALEGSREMYGECRDKAIEGSKAADRMVRDNPYQAIAIGVGVGVVFGYLLNWRGCGSRK